MFVTNVDLNSDSEEDADLIEKILKAGVEKDFLKPLSINPEYPCTANNYEYHQRELNNSFDSFPEFLEFLKESDNLYSVRYALGFDLEYVDCFSCRGTGYSQIGLLLSKTFYKHNQKDPRVNKEVLITDNGEMIISYYGWGSEHDYNEDDFEYLKSTGRIPNIKDFEDFKNYLSTSTFGIDAINRHHLIKGRALKHEKSTSCKYCSGESSLVLPIKNELYKLYVWITDLDSGNCGEINVYNIKEQEIPDVKDFILNIKEEKNALFKEFINNGLEMDRSLFNWHGQMFKNKLYNYDNFEELIDDFGFAPDYLNEFANIYVEDDCLYIWVLHPRKGKSVAIKAGNLKEDLSKYQEYLKDALI